MNDITDMNGIIKKISSASRVVTFESPLTASFTPITTKGNKFFENYATRGNPFITTNVSEEDDAEPINKRNSADTDIDDTNDNLNATLNTRRRRESSVSPLLTTTTINVVKMIARYLEMMTVLSHISWDVFQGLIQLYQLYFHTIISFFNLSASNIPGSRVEPEVKKLFEECSTVVPMVDAKALTLPRYNYGIKLSPKVDTQPSALYGLPAMAVAAESLFFVKQSLDLIQPHLPGFLPKTHQQALNTFYASSVNSIPQVHLLLFKGICNKFIPAQTIISEMQNVNWRTKDIPMHHSPYVTTLKKALTEFSKKFTAFLDNSGLSSKIEDQMWSSMISHVCDCMVEGFATPNCTPEGRAMMGIDLRNVENIIDSLKITDVKHIFQVVDVYIKAFYMPNEELEEWIRSHTEYTPSQRSNLINAGEWEVNAKKKALRVLNK
eukprot:TRINITY_DN6820_c0_g1_i2.p1 TRINITY_DN6820_c0_g1~~TRINITY_DN6820_c0_g1_i2.p1  ORF type:complete len:437 (-),score=71.42 TRINITY_DN6820_c0_g1_i2:5-1315(-)